jgi:hypothetical protein
MPNPAPVLTLSGRVHSVTRREVPALDALPEVRDESGRVTQAARQGRAAYETTDVTVLTDEGGFVTAVLSDQDLSALGGELPSEGAHLEFACRPFVKWTRYGERSASSVGLSIAGDLTAKRRASGRRLQAAASS